MIYFLVYILCFYIFYSKNDGLYGKLLPDCSVPAMEGEKYKKKHPHDDHV